MPTVGNRKLKAWFRPKWFGWGWYPCSWEGVAVLLVFVAAILINVQVHAFAPQTPEFQALYYLQIALWLVLVLVVCDSRCDQKPGWRWQVPPAPPERT